jgi:IS30 family transposase
MKYKRLSLEEREQIFALVHQGKSSREIAKSLNRSHTTISAELKRCGTKFDIPLQKLISRLVGMIL